MKINIRELEFLCTADLIELEEMFLCDNRYSFQGSEYLYHQSPGNQILAVAHLDTVFDSQSFEYLNSKSKIVLSPNLDDRLGVFAILELLPQLGIKCDILLTYDEERGASTASQFALDCPRDYNWIVEFDRAGSDVVLYQYEDAPGLQDDLKRAGFKLGIGSYSDISCLDSLGTGCFNVGIGYHFQHTEQCCAPIRELVDQLYLFKAFYDQFQGKRYEYKPVPASRWDDGFDDYSVWNNPQQDDVWGYLSRQEAQAKLLSIGTGRKAKRKPKGKKKKSTLWESL